MRKIARIFAMEWSRTLQYRADLFLWTIAEAMTPLIAGIVWYRVTAASPNAFTSTHALTYYFLVILISSLTGAWGGGFLAQEILNGDIAKALLRPFSIFWNYIANNLVEKFFKILLPLAVGSCLVLWRPGLLLPEVYQLSSLVWCGISICLAAALNFVLDLTLASCAFWLEDANQLRYFRVLLQEVASGILIPFALLPAGVASVFSWLPFRYTVAVPVELAMGRYQGAEIATILGLQVLWVVGLTALLAFVWKRGLQQYAVPGQ